MQKRSSVVVPILILLLLIAFALGLYFYLKIQNNNNSKSEEYSEPLYFAESLPEITTSEFIEGLENVKIVDIKVDSSKYMSVIDIYLDNISDKKIDTQKCHLCLYDDGGKILFGSSVKIPDIEPNSKADFKVICSTGIDNMSKYTFKTESDI